MTLNGLTFTHDQEKYSYTLVPTMSETSVVEYTYHVNFILRDGAWDEDPSYTVTSESGSIQVNISQIIPVAPRAGMTFVGWALSTASTTASQADITIVHSDNNGVLNLYAIWRYDFQLSFSVGSQGSAVASKTYRVESQTAPTHTFSSFTSPTPAEEYYAFDGWAETSGGTTYVTQVTLDHAQIQTKTLYAHWHELLYTIRWLDEGGTILETDTNVRKGSTPQYNGTTPTKAPTAQYTYAFSGWSPEVTAVTGNTDYTAQYTPTVRSYTVQFKNHDGTVLQSTVYEYGATPQYNGTTPEKDPTAQYSYVFSGWNTEIVPVTGPATYTAQFTQSVNKYWITFENYDGAELQRTQLDYGATPEYTGTTPEKSETDQYTYGFAGWSPAIAEVTGDATYTAQYTPTVRSYTIIFRNENGTVLQSKKYEYGETPEYTGTTPTKAPTAKYTYAFSGWDSEITAVTGAKTYTAQYSSTVNKYWITFVNDDGTTLRRVQLDYGATPVWEGENPTKANTQEFTYAFTGWTPMLTTVTESATYIAQYGATPNEYTITWKDYDGTVLREEVLVYGTIPSYSPNPEREDTAEWDYTFSGWSPNVTNVTKDTIYTAQYSQTKKVYTVTYSLGQYLKCIYDDTTYIGPTTFTAPVAYGEDAPLPELTCTDATESDAGDEFSSTDNYTRVHKEWENVAVWTVSNTAVSTVRVTGPTTVVTKLSRTNIVTTIYRGWIVNLDMDWGNTQSIRYSGTGNTYQLTVRPTAPSAYSQFEFYRWNEDDTDLAEDPILSPGTHNLKAIWIAYAYLVLDADSADLRSWMTDNNNNTGITYDTDRYRTTEKIRKGTSHVFSLPALAACYDYVTKAHYYFRGFNKSAVSVPAGRTDTSVTSLWGQYSIAYINGSTAYTQTNNAGANETYSITITDPSRAGYEFRGWIGTVAADVYCNHNTPSDIKGDRADISSVAPKKTVALPKHCPGYGDASNLSEPVINVYAVWYEYYHVIRYRCPGNDSAWKWGEESTAYSAVWTGTPAAAAVTHIDTIPKNPELWFRGYVLSNSSGVATTPESYILYRAYVLNTETDSVVTYLWTGQQYNGTAIPDNDGDYDYTPLKDSPSEITLTIGYDSVQYVIPKGVSFTYSLVYYIDDHAGRTPLQTVTGTNNVPGYGTVDALRAGPSDYTGDEGAVRINGAALFRGWKNEAGTLFKPGMTAPAVFAVASDQTPDPYNLYGTYLMESDLNTWTIHYYLNLANHCHATLNVSNIESKASTGTGVLVNGLYERQDIVYSHEQVGNEQEGKKDIYILTLVFKKERSFSTTDRHTLKTSQDAWVTGQNPVYTATESGYEFKGWSSPNSVPNDEGLVLAGSNESIQYSASTREINIYPTWYRFPVITARITDANGQPNDIVARSAISYGWESIRNTNNDELMAIPQGVGEQDTISLTLWDLAEDLGYTSPIMGDRTIIGYSPRDSETARVYGFEETFSVKTSELGTFEKLYSFLYFTVSEPEVEIIVRNTNISGITGQVTASAIVGQAYYYGMPISYSDAQLKSWLMTDTSIPKYKYKLASWTIKGIQSNGNEAEVIAETQSSQIQFTPDVSQGYAKYRVYITFGPASYTLRVHVKYSSGVTNYNWIAPFIVTYGVGVEDPINIATIRDRLVAAATDDDVKRMIRNDVLITSATLSTLSRDECYYNQKAQDPYNMAEALDQRTDDFSPNGADVEVYAQFGKCPTSIEMGRVWFKQDVNRISCSAIVSFDAASNPNITMTGDGRAVFVIEGQTVDWTYTVSENESTGEVTTVGVCELPPGTYTITARTAATDANGNTITADGKVRVGVWTVVFSKGDAAISVNLPKPLYSLQAESFTGEVPSLTTPTISLSGYVASANVRGWVFMSWSDLDTTAHAVTSVTPSEPVTEVYPTWAVNAIFRYGQGTVEGYPNNSVVSVYPDGVLGHGNTRVYVNLPTQVAHPTMQFDCWTYVDGDGLEQEAANPFSIGPGVTVFTAKWVRRDIKVSWGKMRIGSSGYAESAEDSTLMLGTQIVTDWATQYTPSDGTVFTFSNDGRPRILNLDFMINPDETQTPINIYYRGELVWKKSVAGQVSTITLSAKEIPDLAFSVVDNMISNSPSEYFTGDLIAAGDEQISETGTGADRTWTISGFTVGSEIELTMGYADAVSAEVRSEDLTYIGFVEVSTSLPNVGNWARISNEDEVVLNASLTVEPSEARVYEVRKNRQNIAYFTEIFTPALRVSPIGVNKYPEADRLTVREYWGTISIAPRAPAGKYAVVFTAYVEDSGEMIEHEYILTFEIIDAYGLGPLCELYKHVKVNGSLEQSHLYLARPDLRDISITSVERSFQSKLTTIPILTKSSEYNYCIDLGTKETLTFKVSRTAPKAIDDESKDEWKWSNRKWLEHVKTFFDEWQNLNYDSSGKRAGGYELTYDPYSSATLPKIHKNVFMSGPLVYEYGRAIVNMTFQFTVASMLGRSAIRKDNAAKVVYISVIPRTNIDDQGHALNKVQLRIDAYEYYRDIYTIADLPTAGTANGALGWIAFGEVVPVIYAKTGSTAGEVFDLNNGAELTGDGFGIQNIDQNLGIYTPGSEQPVADKTIYYVLYSGEVTDALIIDKRMVKSTDNGKAQTKEFDILPMIEDKLGTPGEEYFIKVTAVGGGGGGGDSKMTIHYSYQTPKGHPRRAQVVSAMKNSAQITSSVLGGGGASGACRTRVYDISSLTFEEGKFMISATVGAGGLPNKPGEMSKVIMRIDESTIPSITAAGGGAGSENGAGRGSSGGVQYAGGENLKLDTPWTYGSLTCKGQDGSPPGFGGAGHVDRIEENGNDIIIKDSPSSGGAASALNVIYPAGVKLWKLDYGARQVSGYPGSPSASTIGYVYGESARINLLPDQAIRDWSSLTASANNVIQGVIQGFNLESAHSPGIDAIEEYDGSKWIPAETLKLRNESTREGTTDITSKFVKSGLRLDFLYATGELLGEYNRWYRIRWHYQTSSVGNTFRNLISGKVSTSIRTDREFGFKILPPLLFDRELNEARAMTSYGAELKVKESDYIYNELGDELRAPTYGGGGCSQMRHVDSPNAIVRNDSEHVFHGSSGADGVVLIEVIKADVGRGQ